MKNKTEIPDSQRRRKVLEWLADARRDRAERLENTRRLFGERVVIIDPHTHSNYSDGRSTIEQNREAAIASGLDFLFATDHLSLMQKRKTKKFKDVSWGQEPGAGSHHIGLLCNKRLFKPACKNLHEDFKRAKNLSPFVWIPHPAGWYPSRTYNQEQISALWTIGNNFALEVLNGAHKIERAFDRFDEKAVEVWDRLLCSGRHVTPIGGSDAHLPESIGSAWTAVLRSGPVPGSLIESLKSGLCLASEAGLLDLRLGGKPMGGTLRVKKGETKELFFRAVDSAGLQRVRIISDGKPGKTLYPRGENTVSGTWTVRPGGRYYFRLESQAVDDRRAFSAPVYVQTVK